jgi:hypothetical protein
MSRKEDKRLQRFKKFPKDYTYDELVWVLEYLGFHEDNRGKTSGSRVVFINDRKEHVYAHKPHPGNVLKPWVAKNINKQLENYGIFI